MRAQFHAEKFIQHPFRLFFTGRSGFGKTTCLVDIVDRVMRPQMGKNGRLIVISPSWDQEAYNPIRDLLKSERDLYEEPQKGMFLDIAKRLSKEKKLAKEKGISRPKTLIIVDDFSGTTEIHSRFSGIANLSVRTKHLDVSLFVISQQPSQTNNAYRQNCDGLIAFPPTSRSGFDLLFSEFNSSMMDKRTFLKLCMKAWNGKKEDNSEFGTHFLFILIVPRAPTRYFCDFYYELTPKRFRKGEEKINSDMKD